MAHSVKHEFEPPTTAQELDSLMRSINVGEGYFASLDEEERERLKNELSEAWLSDYLDDYPVPADIEEARREYRVIADGARYPNLPDNVRNDLLLHFDDRYGEGGPGHWPTPLCP